MFFHFSTLEKLCLSWTSQWFSLFRKASLTERSVSGLPTQTIATQGRLSQSFKALFMSLITVTIIIPCTDRLLLVAS